MATITDVEGVYAGGLSCGIKENCGADLAFIYVPQAAGAAGVFTRNAFAAAPVQLSREHLSAGAVKACVINSGSANAGTGPDAILHARRMTDRAAELLGLERRQVAVASTGCIGKPLPIARIEAGLDRLLQAPLPRDGSAAAGAIMTTDTRAKEVFYQTNAGGQTVQVGGIAKGSGMIAPNMATMLAFLATNAALPSASLRELLAAAVDDTFNMVSVDGDNSTNDSVLLFSGSAAPCTTAVTAAVRELLFEACRDLARQIAADGEGATRLIEAVVRGAASRGDARRLARSIIESPLVKTAMHGADPNWGRIIAAAGKVDGCRIDPDRVELVLQGCPVLQAGRPVPFERPALARLLNAAKVEIVLDLHLGKDAAAAWGCDLTARYVEINTEYS